MIASILRGFRATVSDLGGDAHRYGDIVGLGVRALGADDVDIPIADVCALLRHASKDLHCSDLGLRVAAHQDAGVLGPLAWAVRSCASLGDAYTLLSRYLPLSCPLSLECKPDPYDASSVLGVCVGADVSDAGPQATDLFAGLGHRVLLDLTGGRYGLRSVELAHRPQAPLSTYERFFGAPVRTARPEGMLRVPTTLFGRPIEAGSPHLRQLAEALLAAQLAPAATRRVTPVARSAIRQALGGTAPSIVTIAAILAVHPRTLQRQLAAEDTTFAVILDDVRREAAHHYLTATDLPMTRVADMLGLSAQSALTRCCRRWWSMTPTDVRRDPPVNHSTDPGDGGTHG
jgi:AraC-like DNA-binding protein